MELNGFDHFLFFVVCVLLPGLSLMSAKTPDMGIEPVLPAKKHIYFTNGLMLWIGALLVITNWNLSERSWELLGMQAPIVTDLVIIMCVLLLIIYAGDSIYNILQKDDKKEEELMQKVLPENWKEYSQFVFLAVSAGVCEEFVYRGFLVNYFLEITKGIPAGPYLSIIIPACVFSISHLYQGWFNVFKIFSLALLFCGIFLYSQSLLLVVVLHVFVDLLSGAIVVILAQRENDFQKE